MVRFLLTAAVSPAMASAPIDIAFNVRKTNKNAIEIANGKTFKA